MKKQKIIVLLSVAIVFIVLATSHGYVAASEFYYDELYTHDPQHYAHAHHGIPAHSMHFILLDIFFIDENQTLFDLDEYMKWATKLIYKELSPNYDYELGSLVNVLTFIERFDISRESFQELLDEWPRYAIYHNLDVLYSGDRAFIYAYYAWENSIAHSDAVRANEDRLDLAIIYELQQIVNDNRTMSRYVHDIFTFAQYINEIGIASLRITLNWMRGLVEAGEYDRVNMADLVSGRPTLTRERVEKVIYNNNLNLFTHYNLDVIFSNDWDLIRSYYALENEARHTALIQERFEAYSAEQTQIAYIRIRADNSFIPIPADDQQPVLTDGRTLVPLRAVMEYLGFTVDWQEAESLVTLTMGANHAIQVQIDNLIMRVNGIAVPLDVSPKLINGRTMVPVRAIAEATGFTVNWMAQDRIVDITF